MSLTPTGFPSGGVFPTGFPGAGGPGGVSISGNTAGTTGLISTGTLILDGGNNITLSQSGNTITIVGGAGGGGGGINLSLSGNTSGTLTLISSGTAILAGGNNITLSQVGQSVTISAFNQSVQTQNLHDVSLSGNTAGALALVSSGTLILAGGNNITLSQNGQSVTVSAFNQTVQTQNLIAASLSGNTAGALALVSSGTLILAGGNNITLSQNGQSVTISDNMGTVNQLWLMQDNLNNGSTANAFGAGTPAFWPMQIQGFATATQAFGFLSLSISTSATANSTNSGVISLQLGVYTKNVSTLSLIAGSSGSTAYSWTFTSNNSTGSLSGLRMASLPINMNFTPGDYWLGALSLTTTGGNLGFTGSQLCGVGPGNANLSGFFATANVTSNQMILGFGLGTVSTAALPASIGFNAIQGQGGGGFHFFPMYGAANITV